MVRLTRPARRALLLVAVVLACLTAGVPTYAAQRPVPELTQPVHDFAGVIDEAAEAQLDRLIRSLQAGTGDTIAVVTIDTFQPDYGDIRDYAVKLFENHGRGIGEKGKDNGVLVLLAVNDRRVHVEVGYGLEGAITDGYAGETSRLYMRPHFQQGDYGAGLLAGVTRLASRIAEERQVAIADLPRVEPAPRPQSQDVEIPTWALLLMLLVLYNVIRASLRSTRGGRRRRGGGVYWGGPSGWSGWGGGGSFGGGSFGGGFGGFGGGRSGGGGGGASW